MAAVHDVDRAEAREAAEAFRIGGQPAFTYLCIINAERRELREAKEHMLGALRVERERVDRYASALLALASAADPDPTDTTRYCLTLPQVARIAQQALGSDTVERAGDTTSEPVCACGHAESKHALSVGGPTGPIEWCQAGPPSCSCPSWRPAPTSAGDTHP